MDRFSTDNFIEWGALCCGCCASPAWPGSL